MRRSALSYRLGAYFFCVGVVDGNGEAAQSKG